MNKKIQNTELDFDGIKQSLKTFLQGQSEFSDYNFEGSGLSVLLDVLSLNTHYNALYLNLALNEAFLDTASKRSSVVSKAKELGYVPRSVRSSTAVVRVTFINDNISAPDFIEIPEYAIFTTMIDGITYKFYTTQTYIAYRQGNQYIFENVILKEGQLYQYSYEYAPGSSFVVPNKDVDISTLSVTVQELLSSATTDAYTNSDDIINIDGNSKVYFIHENYDGLYEIQFGNGDIGKQLENGNYITLRYLISSKDLPNGASSFSYIDGSFVTTISSAAGGSGAEDIDSIRWNAPRYFSTQNRCVTANDYEYIIKTMYNARDVSVWGGDTMTPPQYGKVYISVIPQNAPVLSDSEKQFIMNNIINPRKALSITPEFIDPVYIDLQLNVKFKYDPNLTNRNTQEMVSVVNDTITSYNDRQLSTFDGVFRMSRFMSEIDACEESIISNSVSVMMYRSIDPIYNVNNTYVINIGNAIKNSPSYTEAVISSGFYISGSDKLHYIEDQTPSVGSIGNMRLFYRDNLNNKVYVSNIGTIDYATGFIRIVNLNIVALYTNEFQFKITPENSDIVSSQNQFIRINSNLNNITPVIGSTKGL